MNQHSVLNLARVLNLGAGVQSTALYLMFMRGEINPQIDCAIFADTGEEPDAVYRHLDWLIALGGPEIKVRSIGKLGDDLIKDRVTGVRSTSIPGFTAPDERPDGWVEGRAKRQCSSDYKIEVIERTIKREMLGIAPRGRWPKQRVVQQFIGISLDEAGRARRIAENHAKKTWSECTFPLLDAFMTRANCLEYLADKVPHETPRSACVFCPFHSDYEWDRIKREDPEGWARAVHIDTALRTPGRSATHKMRQKLYLHRSCKPLELVQLDTRIDPRKSQLSINFTAECMGVCGV